MENRLKIITSDLKIWLAAAALLSILTSNPAWGLLLGSAAALSAGNPAAESTGKVSKKLLQIAVILLGFGMHLNTVIRVGLTSVWITMISISLTLIIGMTLGRMFGVKRNLSLLLST
ncbi:MAG: putative sulfate exporter family transporter, partial [Synergistaceae bacterium]